MGTVILEIMIDEKGVPQVKLLKDIGDGCGDAALMGFRKIAQTWKPAKKNGIPVKMKFIEKVMFKMDTTNDPFKTRTNGFNSSIENIIEEFKMCMKTNDSKKLLELSAGNLEIDDIKKFLKEVRKRKCLKEFVMGLKVEGFMHDLNINSYSIWEHPMKGDVTIEFSYNQQKGFYYLSGCSTNDISCK